MQEKIVGILGGMGPDSTAAFFLRVIKATPAQKDQDHLRIIIDNNPKIPDRTSALLREGESPLEELKKTIRNLEGAGAELIAIPCNTVHYYYDEMQKSANVPIINMISEVEKYVRRELPNIKKIGLIATTGTIKTGVYHKAVKELEVIIPDGASQEQVMNAIYGEHGIKAGHQEKSRNYILKVAKALVKQESEAIIMGCTEISLVLSQGDLPVPLIDPLQILAETVIREACPTLAK